MQAETIQLLADRLRRGEISLEDFIAAASQPAHVDLGEALIDLDRRRRCGFPEVVFGPGKTVATLETIFRTLLADGVDVLSTRVTPEQATVLQQKFPAQVYNPAARTLRIAAAGGSLPRQLIGHVAVITAGTSDLPVAEEARETLDWMGIRVTMIFDVGVAGPHRFPAQLPKLHGIDAAVVIAGMEGALPSVVGGYLPCPVIAVPTSVGYGANFGGVSALLSMLNSCAANVTVVNIDAGFKGAYIAGLIAQGKHAHAK